MTDNPLDELSKYPQDDITDYPERSIYNNGCQHNWKIYLYRPAGIEYKCHCGLSHFEFYPEDTI